MPRRDIAQVLISPCVRPPPTPPVTLEPTDLPPEVEERRNELLQSFFAALE